MSKAVYQQAIKSLLKDYDFKVKGRQMTKAQHTSAVAAIAASPSLQLYLKVKVDQLILRHLEVPDEHQLWVLGGIAAYRKLLKAAEEYKELMDIKN